MAAQHECPAGRLAMDGKQVEPVFVRDGVVGLKIVDRLIGPGREIESREGLAGRIEHRPAADEMMRLAVDLPFSTGPG